MYYKPLDASCGLSSKQIRAIKYVIKNAVNLKLPELPEHVELKLFFQGRDALTYSWRLLGQDILDPLLPFSIEVEAKLKKEFFQYQKQTRYTFICKVQFQKDIYSPKISIRKKPA